MALDSARQLTVEAVELPADTPPAEARSAAQGVSRIDIRFETFKDGRGFSSPPFCVRPGLTES